MLLTLRVMPESCRPCRVVRLQGRALMAVDPRGTRLGVMLWMVDHLTRAEFSAVTQAYGCRPGQPCGQWMTAPAPILLYVPQAIRQTGAPALQGGIELQRRIAAGEMRVEWAALSAELKRQPFAMEAAYAGG